MKNDRVMDGIKSTNPGYILHEVWWEPGELTTLCLADRRGDKCRSLLESGNRLIHRFYASSHYEAMTLYYDFMDWGGYNTEFEIDKQPYEIID